MNFEIVGDGASTYTHDEAARIVDLFESLLDKHGIRIPSPEDDEREADNEAKLYGSVYSELLDSVEDELIDILHRYSHTDGKLVMGVFSGTI